ncbi:MAG: AAA family ATPase [Planctomycetota bacterium]
MRIQKLNIIRFGHLSDIEIDFGQTSTPLHLVFGANEAGKSTTMRAIHALLFGFPARTDDDFQFAGKELRVGGEIADEDGAFAFVRRKGNRKTVLSPSDEAETLDESPLKQMLADLSKEAFIQQYALGHQELVEGGELVLSGRGEVAELLFAAGAGLGHLRAIQNQLNENCNELLRPQSKDGRINAAVAAFKQTQKQLKEALVVPRSFEVLRKDFEDSLRVLEEVSYQRREPTFEYKRLQRQIESMPLSTRLSQVNGELASLGEVAALPDDFRETRSNSAAKLALLNQQLIQIDESIKQLRERRTAFEIENGLIEHEVLVRRIYSDLEVVLDLEQGLDQVLRPQHQRLTEVLLDGLKDLASRDGIHVREERGNEDPSVVVNSLQVPKTLDSEISKLVGEYFRMEGSRLNEEKLLKRLQRQYQESENSSSEGPGYSRSDLKRLRKLHDELTTTSLKVAQVKDEVILAKQLTEDLRPNLNPEWSDDQWMKHVFPSRDLIDESFEPVSVFQSEIKSCDEKIKSLRSQHDELSEQKGRFSDTHGSLPTQRDLDHARERRDEAVRSVLEDSSNAAELFQLLAETDRLVDRFVSHQQTIVQQESLERAGARVLSQISDIEKLQRETQGKLDIAKKVWEAIWSPAPLSIGSPEMMRSIVQDLGRWKEALLRERQFVSQLSLLEKGLDESMGLACKELSDAGSEREVPKACFENFRAIMEELERLIDQLEDALREREVQKSQLETIETQIREAEQLRVDSDFEQEQWSHRWQKLTSDLSIVDCEPEQAQALLESIAELGDVANQRLEVARTISESEARLGGWNQRVMSLAEALSKSDPQLDEVDCLQSTRSKADFARDLNRRLVETIESTKKLEEVEKEISKQEALQNQNREQAAVVQSTIEDLCRQAACESPDELPTAETRHDRWRELVREKNQLESQLQTLSAGDVDQRSASDDDRDSVDMIDLEMKLQDAEQAVEEADQKWREAHEKHLRLKVQWEAIDGGDQAATLQQELVAHRAEVAEHASQYIRLKLASGLLVRTMEQYRKENQQPVLKIAERYFSRLTDDRYKNLLIRLDDDDQPRLEARRGTDDHVPAHRLSQGTADSLYLALRLASLRHQCESNVPMPLILDDCLIRMDNRRRLAAMEVLAELSETTQVIMFTHDRSMVDSAGPMIADGRAREHRLG